MSSRADGELSCAPDRRGGVCVLIPVKERGRCKTRLARTLVPAARLALVRSMLATVLRAAGAARTVSQVLVISPERDEVPPQVPVLRDDGRSLNGALSQARTLLCARGCTEVVILPADLPRVTAAEIDALVRAGRERGFAIAPDAAGAGTNALYLRTSLPLRFRFGSGSERQHLREARRLGLAPAIVRLPGLALDVDTAADLARLAAVRLERPLQTHLCAGPPA